MSVQSAGGKTGQADMIVLDEQLQGLGLEDAVARWYRGAVFVVKKLRPGMVIAGGGAVQAHARRLQDMVAYLLAADNSIGPLLSRLRGAQQPVVRPRHVFSVPCSHLLARL
jgi:hypothetical protein